MAAFRAENKEARIGRSSRAGGIGSGEWSGFETVKSSKRHRPPRAGGDPDFERTATKSAASGCPPSRGWGNRRRNPSREGYGSRPVETALRPCRPVQGYCNQHPPWRRCGGRPEPAPDP
ncbi:hypothetical protein [Azospirillum largimobile]